MVIFRTDTVTNMNQSSSLKLNFLIGVSTSLCGGIMSYLIINFMNKTEFKELIALKKELIELFLIVNKDQPMIIEAITLYLENFCSKKMTNLRSNDSAPSRSNAMGFSDSQVPFFHEKLSSDHSFFEQIYEKLLLLQKNYPKFKNIHAPTIEEVYRYREHHKKVVCFASTLYLDIRELLLKERLAKERRFC